MLINCKPSFLSQFHLNILSKQAKVSNQERINKDNIFFEVQKCHFIVFMVCVVQLEKNCPVYFILPFFFIFSFAGRVGKWRRYFKGADLGGRYRELGSSHVALSHRRASAVSPTPTLPIPWLLKWLIRHSFFFFILLLAGQRASGSRTAQN